MALFTFRLPDIGEGIAEAEIVALHVAVGDVITEDQPVADMMTDKATVEMESPVSGVVRKIAGEVGDVIAIGSMLIEVEVEGDDAPEIAQDISVSPAENVNQVVEIEEKLEIAAETPPPAPEPVAPPPPAPVDSAPAVHARILASPAVRARAEDLGIALGAVQPSEDGRVRHADLDAYLRYNGAGGFATGGVARADEAVKVIGLRRRIADNMAAAKRNIPHFTYVEEMEVTALEAMRADLNANRGDNPKLTMLPFLILAICRTLPQFPMLNARFDDAAGVVTRHGAVHLGMATQTDAGLMVPVIRDAQSKNVWQLAREISRLAEAARTGKAKSEELSGSTITVTSLGPLGGVATTPVINRPEVAILGPNRIVERPVFVDGHSDRVRRAKLMNFSISCDHRVVDGWDAASFVQALKKLVETPVLLFAN
ncbi:MAG: 2-oxo acid dehydrogenase subunit E2 [Sphingomonadaceae bacterium]|nr:2-oxo acid dehydrogenase subunit E2 [Sphingomonadaceae bacterium]